MTMMEPAATPQVSTPKKRGRKRKQDIALQVKQEEISPDTTSRRGRRRKQINYFDMENPGALEDVPWTPVRQDTDDEDDPKAKRPKVDTVEKKKRGPKPKAEVIKREKSPENGHVEEDTIEEEQNGDTPSTSKDNKKYKYTGETVKMINTLFSFCKTEDNEDEANANSEVAEVSVTPNVKIPRTYRKKSSKTKELDVSDASGQVTCAVCNISMEKTIWLHHKQRQHNNLAWRVGDSPIDLSDQSLVMYTLNALYKKKKPLYCSKCGLAKKSVVGFLSHQSQCLKSEEQLESVKIACALCGKKMLPVSMSTHMKYVHPDPTTVDTYKKKEQDLKVLSTKRGAAKKALKIIENVTNPREETYYTSNLDFGAQDFAKDLLGKKLEEGKLIMCLYQCGFKTDNVEEALTHLDGCTSKLHEGFACKQCLLVVKKLEDIIFHVESIHSLSVIVDEEDDFSISDKAIKLPQFLGFIPKKTSTCLFVDAFRWTYKFHQQNCATPLHLALPLNQWPILPAAHLRPFLPRLPHSCHVARSITPAFANPFQHEHPQKTYELFETEIHPQDHKITIFCGGPISAQAWLPTPFDNETHDQILAVAILNSPDEKFATQQNYAQNTAIQFWNFGVLKNKTPSLVQPRLVFNLAYARGPVWHLEWCPSGCHDPEGEKKQLGLLALAGSDSVVCIYDVPYLSDHLGLYYKPEPVIKLLLQRPGSPSIGGLNYYATKISWSKGAGHRFIAVGYTNGFVALFDLKNDSFLLKYRDNEGITCFLPYKCFHAHSHSISALTLYHLNGGNRWLMTGSFDRSVSVWDLNNPSYPIVSSSKNIITDGFWFTNWLTYATASDEGSTSTYITTGLKAVRDFMCEPTITLTCSTSTVSSISGSDWLNGIIHGNTMGEIVAIFPHQVLHVPDPNKSFKKKRMLFGYTHLISRTKSLAEQALDDKNRKKVVNCLLSQKFNATGVKLSNKSNLGFDELICDEPVLYDEAAGRYALLFCDNQMESFNDFPATTNSHLLALSKAFSYSRPNQYPLNAVNKVSFNPNRQSSLYYASGYQAGFIRLSWMQFLKDDLQIR